MNAYDILLHVHHVGSLLKGSVIARDAVTFSHGMPGGYIHLETSSRYPVLLPYAYLVDQPSEFTLSNIPEVGAQIEVVVFNCVEGRLCVSARPCDLAEATIEEWKRFYRYIGTLEMGSPITGTVQRAVPFGLFVDIGGPYLGLVDIGFTRFYGGSRLPREYSEWPKEGDSIVCKPAYISFHNKQIGLAWLPESMAEG